MMNDEQTSNGCPYLGLLDDPQTRIGHTDELHHCFGIRQPIQTANGYLWIPMLTI